MRAVQRLKERQLEAAWNYLSSIPVLPSGFRGTIDGYIVDELYYLRVTPVSGTTSLDFIFSSDPDAPVGESDPVAIAGSPMVLSEEGALYETSFREWPPRSSRAQQKVRAEVNRSKREESVAQILKISAKIRDQSVVMGFERNGAFSIGFVTYELVHQLFDEGIPLSDDEIAYLTQTLNQIVETHADEIRHLFGMKMLQVETEDGIKFVASRAVPAEFLRRKSREIVVVAKGILRQLHKALNQYAYYTRYRK